MANIKTVKKTIRGKEYVAQFNGISAALEAIDGSYIEGSENTSLVKLSKYIFENVIVNGLIQHLCSEETDIYDRKTD